MHPIEQELQAVTALTPQVGERRPAFLHRLLSAGQELTNTQWNALSPDAQRWYNDAIKSYNLHNDPNDIADFGPDTAPEPEQATNGQTDGEGFAGDPTGEQEQEQEQAAGDALPADDFPTGDIPFDDDEGTSVASGEPAPAAEPPPAAAPPAAAPKAARAPRAPKSAAAPKPATKPGTGGKPKPAGGKPGRAAAAAPPPAQPAQTTQRAAMAAPAPRQQLSQAPTAAAPPATSPPAAAAPPKPSSSGVSTMVKRLLIRNIDMTHAELLEKVRASGGEVSDNTVANIRSEFRHSIRVLHEAGYAREIKV